MTPDDSKPTMLVVDDEPALLRLVVRVLEREGYSTLSARAGDDAIELFDRCRDQIDGVILDVVIPPNGGGEVLEHMISVRPDLMMILASGDEPQAELSARIREVGAVFLRKPFLPKALIGLIESGLAARC